MIWKSHTIRVSRIQRRRLFQSHDTFMSCIKNGLPWSNILYIKQRIWDKDKIPYRVKKHRKGNKQRKEEKLKMKMKKIIVVVMVLCVILSHMDSAEAESPDCYDQCSTACVQSDSKCLSKYICTLFSIGRNYYYQVAYHNHSD